MKFAVAVACLAGAVAASPIQVRAEQAEQAKQTENGILDGNPVAVGYPGGYPPGYPGGYPPGYPGGYPPGYPGGYPPGYPGGYNGYPVGYNGGGILGGNAGGPGNFVSNIFDGAACIVSGVIGGGNPRCRGQGVVVPVPVAVGPPAVIGTPITTPPSSSQYNYTYDTDPKGNLLVTITLARGGSCSYTIPAVGQDIQQLVKQAGTQCLSGGQ